jgi:HlyD family secretion protein
MNKSRIKIIAGVVVLLLLSLAVVRTVIAGPQTAPTKKDIDKAARVSVPAAGTDERNEVPKGNFVAGNGVVEPADRETKVASQVPGRIAKIFAKEGDVVRAGAPLVELDGTVETAALAAAEGDLASARADLLRTLRGQRKEDIDAIVADTASVKAKASLSEESLERTEKLARTGAATPDELDRARRQSEIDKAALQSSEARRHAALAGSRSEDIVMAQARVQAAEARRDQARATLDRLTIRAPIAGEVLALKLRVGEYYTPGGQDPLLIMGDTSKLRVRMDVDERDIAKIKPGASAFATLPAFIGRHVRGKVVEIGKRMGRKNVRTDDPTERIDTKILEVVIELEGADGLVPGLRVVAYVDV